MYFMSSETSRLADFTYVHTQSGWIYVAFVIDVYSRIIVGWYVSTKKTTDMVLNALEQSLVVRGDRHRTSFITVTEAANTCLFVIPVVCMKKRIISSRKSQIMSFDSR